MAPSIKRLPCGFGLPQWQQIRGYLFNKVSESEIQADCYNPDTTADDSIVWEDMETEEDEDDEDETSENKLRPAGTCQRQKGPSWLHGVYAATIPTFEFFAFAFCRRIIAFESMGEEGEWRRSFQMELPASEINVIVCLPVTPNRVTDPRPYEWTAVLIGLADGHIIALNGNGEELLVHRFHTKPVIEMKLQTDQLFVSYSDYLVAVSGFTLLTTLKTNRNRALRQRVSSPRSRDTSQMSSVSTADSLVYDHWRLENIDNAGVIVATGPRRTTIWEKMATASIKGGYNASISNRQPSYETFCAANSKNFMSFNWWTDETPPSILEGITSRLKSSVSMPTWSSWWSPSPSKASATESVVTQITVRAVTQRSCIPDDGRTGEVLLVAPGDRLAVVCDDLGRVSVVDVRDRVLLRMWKGYRDAQCAWMQLPYSGQDKTRCDLLCLVIFAPRRGILEIWSIQNGRRAAAFNVDRNGLLIYCPSTTLTRSNFVDTSQAVRFLDSKGQFFQLDISAAAVTEPHETSTFWSAPAKEDFRKQWKRKLTDESELKYVLGILDRLVWTKDATYLVDRVVESANPVVCKLFIRFVDAVIHHLSGGQGQSPDAKFLHIRCVAYRQITHFVAMVWKFHNNDHLTSTNQEQPDYTDDHICQLLALGSPTDLHDLLHDLDRNMKLRIVSRKSESSNLDLSSALRAFISTIDYRSLLHNAASPNINAEQNARLTFRKECEEDALADLGDFVFKPFLTGHGTTEEFAKNVRPLLGLIERDWTRIFCAYWIHKDRSYSVHPASLYNLTSELYATGGHHDLIREVRRLLVNSGRSAEAVSLCLVVRALVKNNRSKDGGDREWCSVEKDVEDWDVLLAVLRCLMTINTCCQRIVKFDGNGPELEPLSARQLLMGGGGCLSEWLAKSFVLAGVQVNAELLTQPDSTSSPWANDLKRAREMMPRSLETERLVMATLWEYVRVWYKTPSRTDCLSAATVLLNDLQDERLRQGFASLAWRTFFNEHYKKLVGLMMSWKGEECGEQFQLDTGIPAAGLLEFVRFVHTLFDVMKECAERWRDNTARPYETEEILQNFTAAFKRDISDEPINNVECLWDLLTRQPANIQHQIDLHWQLTAAVFMAVSTDFETRLTPLSLFSWDERLHIFKNLTSKRRLERLADDDAEQQQLSNRRLLFLLSYVTEAIKSSTGTAPPTNEDESAEKRLLPDLSLAVKMARIWNLNFDAVRRQEIVQLYLAGWPDLASKLLPLVEDRRQLACTLLDMAGCAMSDRWTPTPTNIKHKLTSALWNWLMSRRSSENAKGPRLNVRCCKAILDYARSTFPPNTTQFKMADELRAAMENVELGKM